MLVMPIAGEVFGSFFLTRPGFVLLTGCVLSLFSTIGSWNRLRLRQKEAEEPQETALRSQKILCLLIAGATIFLAALLLWQWKSGYLPAFRKPL